MAAEVGMTPCFSPCWSMSRTRGLEDGSSAVAVVLREVAHQAGTGLTDISEAGGWRAYRASAVG